MPNFLSGIKERYGVVVRVDFVWLIEGTMQGQKVASNIRGDRSRAASTDPPITFPHVH
jgi:hypothetical protein